MLMGALEVTEDQEDSCGVSRWSEKELGCCFVLYRLPCYLKFLPQEREYIPLPLDFGLGYVICLRQWDLSRCNSSRGLICAVHLCNSRGTRGLQNNLLISNK